MNSEMNNDRSSEIIANSNSETQNDIAQSDRNEPVIETQRVSLMNAESNDSFDFKKWLIAGGVVALTLAICILLSKENDFCLFSTCNSFSDSTATELSAPTTSIEDDFIAYAGGAATLLVLTLVGIPLLPAVAISTGIWLVMQMIN